VVCEAAPRVELRAKAVCDNLDKLGAHVAADQFSGPGLPYNVNPTLAIHKIELTLVAGCGTARQPPERS